MTKREGAIISAFTGILIGKFSDTHKYIEELLDRPLFTHELASLGMREELKEKSKEDFEQLNRDIA